MHLKNYPYQNKSLINIKGEIWNRASKKNPILLAHYCTGITGTLAAFRSFRVINEHIRELMVSFLPFLCSAFCSPFQCVNIQPSLLALVKQPPRQFFVFFQKSFIQPFLFCVPNNLYNFFICILPAHRRCHARHRHSCFLHSMNAIGKIIGIRILTTDFKCPGGIVPDNLPIF